jgi:hypothetical protein
MQKLFLLTLLSCLFAFSSCSPKTTAAAGGGDDYAALAANYKKNPAALQAFVEDCEASQAALTTARQDIANMQSQTGVASQDLNALRNNLTNAQMENDQLRQQLVQLQSAANNDRLDTDQQTVVAGVIFQVQLGAFAQNTVDPDMSTGNSLELQDQNGVQKVVVSQFRTYTNAAQLRDRLKQMGVKDAFVVAKNNGVRITVPEALKMTGQE